MTGVGPRCAGSDDRDRRSTTWMSWRRSRRPNGTGEPGALGEILAHRCVVKVAGMWPITCDSTSY